MNPPSIAARRLQLESLETRTLLAGAADDPFGLWADFSLAVAAVSGTGEYQASFSNNFGNRQLVLTGDNAADITINLDTLPSFITNLKISAFDSVTLIGADKVETVILNGIGTFTANDLKITGSLHATNVDSLSVESAGSMLVLKGDSSDVAVGSLDDTIIISDLDLLTLSVESDSVSLVSLNHEQHVFLYGDLPNVVAVTGLPDSSLHIGLPTPEVPPPPPADPGEDPVIPDTPTEPTKPDLPPSTNPGSDKLVIVSFPLDERTRAFLDELRRMLNSSSGDVDQLVLNFLAEREAAPSVSVSPLIVEDASRFSTGPNLVSDAIARWDKDPQIALSGDKSGPGAALDIAVQSLGRPSLQYLTESGEVDVGWAGGLPSTRIAPMNVDVTWTAPSGPAVSESPNSDTTRKDDSVEGPEITIAEGVRAFGSYVVERVTAEFSPGQQSIVLLVDPQPSRSGANRKAAATAEHDDLALPAEIVQV